MSLKLKSMLESALVATGLVQPVDGSTKGGHVEVLCRQVPGQEAGWIAVVDELLSIPEAKLHLCRRYLHKNGELVFGWHVQVDASSNKELTAQVQGMIEVLNRSRPALNPVGNRPAPAQAPQRSRPNTAVDPDPAPRAAPTTTKFRPGVDENGQPIMEVSEMQLPHVNRDLNVPTAKGKGAKAYAGGN